MSTEAEQQSTIETEGEIVDIAILGSGRETRLVVAEMQGLDEMPREQTRVTLNVYSVATGQLIETLSPDVPLAGGFAIATEGTVSYLHAYGNFFHNARKGTKPEVHSWSFIEGRAHAVPNGPTLCYDLFRLPESEDRPPVVESHTLNRQFLPSQGGWTVWEPRLPPLEDDPSDHSGSSSSMESAPSSHRSRSSVAPQATGAGALLLLAGLISVVALGGWRIQRALRCTLN